MSGKKKKKEKITYIDDGSTIADMSGVKNGMKLSMPEHAKYRPSPRVKDVLRTYFSAMRMMLLPTLVAVGFVTVAFLIMALIFWLA